MVNLKIKYHRFMKSYLSALTFLFFLSNGMAQNTNLEKTPMERAKVQTDWMQKELSLDSIQKEEVYQINLNYAHKIENIKNSNVIRMQKFQAFRSLSEDKDWELKNIFTKDQFKSYLKKKDELHSKVITRQTLDI